MKGIRFFSIEHSDLRRAQRLNLQCDSSHKQSQSLVKNDQFKNEYHSWVKTQKVTFFLDKYCVFREEQ